MAPSKSRTPTALGLGSIIGRALRYWRPHWRAAIVLVFAMLLAQLFPTFFAFSLKLIIDRALVQGDQRILVEVLVALAGAFVVSAAANVYAEYLGAKVASAILKGLRASMFGHMQRLSMGYYARAQAGDVVARFSNDVSEIEKGVTSRLIDLVVALLAILVNLPLLFAVDVRLALVMTGTIPLVLIGTRPFTGRTGPARYQLKQAESAVLSSVQENVRAQAVVKAFGLAGRATRDFDAQLDTVRRHHVRANFLVNLVGASSTLLVQLGQLIVIAAGAMLALRGHITVGTLTTFVSLHAALSKQAYDVTKKIVPALLSSSGGIQRIEELLNTPVSVDDPVEARALPRLGSELKLEGVGFSYGEQKNLDDVTLAIPAGNSVALVGPSGSGKSTVVNMLLRFYDPQTGRVTLDGIDLKSVTQAELHAQMAVVFQENFLFNTSVRENIRLGKLGATDAEVEAAARAAEIHELVVKMPDGYDTVVGEAGGRLSGGQRQRIAIARAIVRDPALLVLDEATSALDAGTEAAINATLARLAEKRTVVSVTHRLGAARDADLICVFDHGVLVESGNHDALVAKHGVYSELWDKQSGVELLGEGRGARVKAERLKAIPLFSEMGDALREEIAGMLVFERVGADTPVFERGDMGDKLYIIARGKVEVIGVDHASGAHKRIAVLTDGDVFGEMALVDDAPRSASVRTLVPCAFMALGRGQFHELMTTSPEMQHAVAKVMAARRAAS